MNNYKHPNGYTYTEDEIMQAAKREGLSLEEFISDRGLELVSLDMPKLETASSESFITHPENNEDFLKASSSFFTQEGDVVSYLNNAYVNDSSKVRFHESGAGRDRVEVTIGSQKPGEGKVYQLNFNQDKNAAVFEDIKSYIDSQGDIKPVPRYSQGDIDGFEEMSITINTNGDEMGVDKTELVSELKSQFPVEATGFTFSTGESKKELVVVAPNGEELRGYEISEFEIEEFINENAVNEDELASLKVKRIKEKNTFATNFMSDALKIIEKEKHLGSVISAYENNPINAVKDTPYLDQIMEAMIKKHFPEASGSEKTKLEKLFRDTIDEEASKELQASILKTTKELSQRIKTDVNAYETYVNTLEEGFYNYRFNKKETKLYGQFQELIRLNHQVATYVGDTNSKEYKDLVAKADSYYTNYTTNFNDMFDGTMLYDQYGNRIDPGEITEQQKQEDIENGDIVDMSDILESKQTAIATSYFTDYYGNPTNDIDKATSAFHIFLSQENDFNIKADEQNINIRLDYGQSLWQENGYKGAWSEGMGGSKNPVAGALKGTFSGIENLLLKINTKGGEALEDIDIVYVDDNGTKYNIADIVETDFATIRQRVPTGFASLPVTILLPKPGQEGIFNKLAEEGVFIKTTDETSEDKDFGQFGRDIYYLGPKKFTVKNISVSMLANVQMSEDDMIMLDARVSYDFGGKDYIDAINGDEKLRLTQKDVDEFGFGGTRQSRVIKSRDRKYVGGLIGPRYQTFDGTASLEFDHLAQNLSAFREDRIDFAIEAEAWKRNFLNIDPGGQERSNAQLFFKGFSEMIPGNYATDDAAKYNFALDSDGQIGASNRLIQDINDVTIQINPDNPEMQYGGLSEDQKKNMEMSFWEKFSYGSGTFVPMIAEFAVTGGILGAATKAVGLTKLVSNLTKVEYLAVNGIKGAKYTKTAINAAKLNQLAKAAGMTRKQYMLAKGFVKTKGGFISQAKALAIGAALEEVKMQMMHPIFDVDMGNGTGAFFYLGGSAARALTPFRFTTKGFGASNVLGTGRSYEVGLWSQRGIRAQLTPGLNTITEKFVLTGVGGMLGSQTATFGTGLVNGLLGNKTFKTFLDDTYHGWEEWGGEALLETVQFGAFGLTSLKASDRFFTMKQTTRFRDRMFKKANDALVYKEGYKIKDKNGKKPGQEGYVPTFGKKRIDKEKSNFNEWRKFSELGHTAQRRLDQAVNSEAYLDVNFLERKMTREYNRFAKQFKKREGLEENPYELVLTKDGSYKGPRGGKARLTEGDPAQVIPQKNGKDLVVVDLRKVTPGTMPHEVYHVLMKKKFQTDGAKGIEVRRAFSEGIRDAITPVLLEKFGIAFETDMNGNVMGIKEREITAPDGTKTKVPLSKFEQKINEVYKKSQSEGTFTEEYTANLLEIILNEKVGYETFIENGLAGAIKTKLNVLRESLFTGTRFEKSLAPKLDLNNPQSVIEFLARMGESWGRGKYNKAQIDRYVNLYKDMIISADGKIIQKKVKVEAPKKPDGTYSSKGLDAAVVANVKPELVKEQTKLLSELRQVVEDLNNKVITVQEYDAIRKPIVSRLNDIMAQVRAGKKPKTEVELLEAQSKKVQEIYDNPKLSIQRKKDLILKEMEPFIKKLSNQKWRGKEFDKEQDYTKIDFEADLRITALELMYPTPGVRVKERAAYKPEMQTPLTQYIMQNLPKRVPSIFEKNISKIQKVGMEKAEKKTTETEVISPNTTGEVINTGVRVADVLKTTKKDGTVEIAVKDNHINEIITNFKNLKNQSKLNFATTNDLAPGKTSDLFGKEVLYTSGKKTGKLDNAATIQKKAEFIVDNWKQIYDALPKGAMTKTGISQLEGRSTQIQDLLLNGRFYKTSGRTKMKETGEAAGLDVQVKIEGLSKQQFLERLGIDIVDGKVVTNRVKTQVRKPEHVNANVIKSLEAEIGRLLTNQTIREHVDRFKQELETTNNPDMLLEKYGLSREFLLRDNVNTFINSVKSGKSEKMASKGITKEQILEFEKIINDPKKELTMSAIVSALSKLNIDKDSGFATVLASKVKTKLKEKISELMERESSEITSFKLKEAKNYKDLAGQIVNEFSSTYPELKKYNINETFGPTKQSYLKNSKEVKKVEKYNKIFVEKMSDFLNISPKEKSGFNRNFISSLGSGKKSGMVWFGNEFNYTKATDGYSFIEANRNKNVKVSKEIKEVFDNFKFVNTQILKEKQANFIKENKNNPDFSLRLSQLMRELQSRDGTSAGYESTVKANNKLRELYLRRISEIINEAPAKEKVDAIVWAMRHLRTQTYIKDGIIKGSAPIRYVSKTGKEFFAEHPLQLLNLSFNFLRIQLGSKNKKEFDKSLNLLNKEFELASTRKSDQKVYDSRVYGSRTGMLNQFKKRYLGLISSIANVLYRPNMSFELLDLQGKMLGETIGDGLIRKHGKKDILDILSWVKKNTPELRTSDVVKLEVDTKHQEQYAETKQELRKQLSRKRLSSKGLTSEQVLGRLKVIDRAKELGRKVGIEKKGMSTFDFDETLIDKGKNFIIATKGKDVVKISSSKWPIDGPKYAKQGYEFDFKDFVNVRGGIEGPLLQKMKNQIKKFGTENVFVLTARPSESATAIHAWLKSKGIDIPLKNITGLGNSTGEAKAMWMLEKFSQGYNDMYFVDDALPNVKAVKDVLSQLDVKSKVQIVRSEKLSSKNLSKEFNKILEESTGMGASKKFSEDRSAIMGKGKGKFKFLFGGYGIEDFAGLVSYTFSGRGARGEEHKVFFEKTLERPYNRAYMEVHSRKQNISRNYKELRKQMPEVTKRLNDKVDNAFTVEQAVRVHLFDLAGYKLEGLSKRDFKKLTNYVRKDAELTAFAEKIRTITMLEKGYVEPSQYWTGKNMTMELNEIVDNVFRKEALAEFVQNREAIFGKWKNGKIVGENMNKIEAVFGPRHREALENMLWRMETGSNRTVGKDSVTNKWMNWVNSATSTIMFFNQKSAALQTISSLNYMNGSFNNPLLAAKAFANQPQYWKDFVKIFNSDMMVQRRAGLKINVEANELITRVGGSKDKMSTTLAYLLQQGFLPTKYADSFAISLGGAAYYRNLVKKYQKGGVDLKIAEQRAFEDFVQFTEITQQSSRPDLISMQQASAIGRPILAFANTPIQMFRRHKRRIQDIANNRGSMTENILSAIYYGAAQTMIFAYLQNAMFATDDDTEDPDKIKHNEKQNERYLNTIVDSYLRGMGTPGATASAIKNGVLRFNSENERGYNADYGNVVVDLLNVSPPIGSKARKVKSALDNYKYNKEAMGEMGFDIDNPAAMSIANIISAATNVPTDRLLMKLQNLRDATNSDFENWERIALFMGWNRWTLGIGDESIGQQKVDEAEQKVRYEKKLKKKMEKYGVTTEAEVIRIDKIKEINALNKNQQQYILKYLGLSRGQINALRKENDRTGKIINMWEDNNNTIDSLLNVDIDKDFDFFYDEIQR